MIEMFWEASEDKAVINEEVNFEMDSISRPETRQRSER